jgi:hypothetical protein
MKVLNLRCGARHVFEGWFGSEADYQDQHARGLVSCPMCGDSAVEKMLTAPRLNLGASAAEAPASVPGPQLPAVAPELQARLWQAMRAAVAQAEDVGERFADEARRMHHGDTEARQIRGRASMEDTLALLEEGVPVLPLPAALKETLQ